jgi:hypothetical protein
MMRSLRMDLFASASIGRDLRRRGSESAKRKRQSYGQCSDFCEE